MAIDGFSTIHVKAKIRSIRNAYLLEIGKIRNSRRLTAGEVYKPRVPWFPIAHRILHGVVQIKGAQPSGIKTEPRTESVDSQEDTPLVIADEELPLSENDLRLTPKATSRKLSSTTAPPIRVSKKIREGSAGKALEELQAIARKLEGKSNKEDDEFDCFGKSCKIRSFCGGSFPYYLLDDRQWFSLIIVHVFIKSTGFSIDTKKSLINGSF
ncbi:hypothetical protein Trydic_g20603 [Trypoxylus dichotomus]